MALRRWKLSIASAFIVAALASSAIAHDMGAMDHDDSNSNSSGTGAMGQMGAHMKMGAHMTMTDSRPATPADTERGELIVKTMRDKLTKYQDYKVALAEGYLPYMETVPQDVFHFASRSASAAEYMGEFDLAHPGSLLYEKQTLGGYKLVGAMYSAPPTDDPAELDKLIPLSLSHWHAHTNICLPAGVTEDDVINGRIMPSHPKFASSLDHSSEMNHGMQMRVGYLADARFGFTGTISEQAECEAVGGTFHKQIFGWMVHVYPFAGDDLKVAFSTEAP
ncbi:MAG: hypothetical protein Q7S58_14150 [Candidatus Binatus sp.]|uniref:hypothetical protein n=1 Tax=Candidatus Binatus sp. TaxID=2811406 RepID=UPI0027202EC7|nr:hypothetical protein [Candidatus Binatus sp.]MDO8433543.1 hypothetical protein [Candidatus Binatus sp.]